LEFKLPDNPSKLLSVNALRIMELWETRANKEVLSALNLESLALRNSLPELLAHIAEALSTTVDRTTIRAKWDRSESLRIGRKHGEERAISTYYTMDQMIFEYHILRQVIFDVMEEKAALSTVDREVIICAVEQAVNDAATQFSQTLKSIQERLAQALTHDLRSPLTAARINAERIMRFSADPQRCKQCATRILTGLDRLDQMVEDLLDASMVQAGHHLSLDFAPCDLTRIAADVIDAAKDVYGDRFILEGDAKAIGNWSERGLFRIVENIVTNAVKYGSCDAPITVSISQGKTATQINIHNHGEGIPKKDQIGLFEQFWQAKQEGNHQGYGIGLTVVKGLVQAQGGEVHVQSSQQSGTTFLIELPHDGQPQD
jgi:signal transduction histidine kinase